jgi:type II secretory pathway component GspD/PulD (secretin)
MPATVLVDVRFVLTSNTDLFDFGIQWANAAGTGGLRIPTATFDPDVSPASPFDPDPATAFPSTTVNRLPFGLGGRLDANWLTTLDLVATLNFFEGAQFTRVVQQPQVAALSGTEATIFSGETRRFAEAQVTTGSGGATTITFQEARSSPVNTGFQLMVIPFVPDSSDEVLLTIVPQLTDLIGFTTFGGGAGGGAGTLSTPIDLPQTASQTVVTRLRVRSGFTVVMGGLTSERQGITENRLPLLADIPIAGWLFKRRDLSDEHRRLLVMLTPYVVRGEQEEAENVRRALSQRGQQELGPLNVLRAESGVDALRDRIRRTQEQESRELERLRGEKP